MSDWPSSPPPVSAPPPAPVFGSVTISGVEAEAAKVRAAVVAEFKALVAKVGKTVAYLLVAAALVFVGHVL